MGEIQKVLVMKSELVSKHFCSLLIMPVENYYGFKLDNCSRAMEQNSAENFSKTIYRYLKCGYFMVYNLITNNINKKAMFLHTFLKEYPFFSCQNLCIRWYKFQLGSEIPPTVKKQLKDCRRAVAEVSGKYFYQVGVYFHTYCLLRS